MSSDGQAVVKYNDAIADVTGGANDVNDFVFQYWYKTNFGDLLQPAPMAVAVLGNLSIVASSIDFKLIPPKDGFKQAQYPDSFRATINQLVDAGATALEKSYTNFDEMQKRCAGVKPGVNNIVGLLSGEGANSEAEMNANIQTFLPRQISQLQQAVSTCLEKAQETDDLFHNLLNLTMEIHESCTATQGDYDTKIQDAKMRESILAQQKIALEENKKLAAQQQEDARKHFEDAQKQFNKAADEMPTGWDLVGMQVVEGLSTALLGAVNAGINKYVGQSHDTTQKQNAAINTAGGVPNESDPSAAPNEPGPSVIPQNVSDPGYQKAQTIRTGALALDALATGGPEKSVDWTKVTASDSGARWIKSTFDVALDGNWTADPASVEAKNLVASGSKLAQQLADLAPNAGNAAAVDPVVKSIVQFGLDAAKFATTAMHKTGTPPAQNAGFAVPTNPPDLNSGSASQMAVKNAQFKIEATQQQLDMARKMSQDSTDKLLQVTESLGQVLGQVAQLNLQQIDWAEVRNVLLRAISFLCQLKGCLASLVHFFDAVNNLVGVTMKDACDQFIGLVGDATKANKSVGGITLSSWTRQTIYEQAMGAAKVAKLVEKISIIYVSMYDQHVQEGVKKLLLMGQWLGGDETNKGKLQTAGAELQTWARAASTGITDLIREEQAKMETDIQDRMTELQTAIKGILPAPSPAIKAAITEATQASITEVSGAIAAADANKPVWKANLGKNMKY